MKWKYLLSDIDFGEDEATAVAEVVRSKWLSLGAKTAEFETAFAERLGIQHAVATSSCTAAIHLALAALGIGPGDEVLVPSYTFVASVNPILYVGATPVFVEIKSTDDLNLCPDDLAAKVTPRSKAIVAVHMAGFPADMNQILPLARRHDLKVIEDACHAIGASYAGTQPEDPYSGQSAGTLGDVGCFSFFANKNLPTGEGGMLVTRDDALAESARRSRSHGMTKSSWDKAAGRAAGYDVTQLGFNYRSTEFTAALGLLQLAKLDRMNDRRRDLVSVYRDRLSGIEGITMPFATRLSDSAHHIFPIVVPTPALREALREALASQGIQTSVHYSPVHRFSHYQQVAPDVELAITEDVAARELTLPLHPLLDDADIQAICDSVQRSWEQLATSGWAHE